MSAKATTRLPLFLSLFCLGMLLLAPLSAMAEDVGRVIVSVGKVFALQLDGEKRALKRRSAIRQGDTIITGNKGRVQIRMMDGAMLALQEQTEFKIRQYRFNGKEDGSENAALDLLKGGMRTITGAIGHKNKKNYSLQTPVGTIGIRGTHYAVQLRDGSLFGGVVDGAVAFTNKAGEQVFGNDQYFRVENVDSAPEPLLTPPEFLFSETAVDEQGDDQQTDEQKTDDQRTEGEAGQDEQASSASENETGELAEVKDDLAADSLLDAAASTLPGDTLESDVAVDYQAAETVTASGTPELVKDSSPQGVGTQAPINAALLGADIMLDANGKLGAGAFGLLNNGENEQIWLDHSGTLPGAGGAANIPVYLYYLDLNPEANNPEPCQPCSFSYSSGSLTGVGGDGGLGVNWGRWQGSYIIDGSNYGTEKGFNWIYSPNVTPYSAFPNTNFDGATESIFNFSGGVAHDSNGNNISGMTGNITVDFIDKQVDSFYLSSSAFTLNSTGAVSFDRRRIDIQDGTMKGEATFVFVGTAAQGLMSSFSASDGSKAVSGAALFKR